MAKPTIIFIAVLFLQANTFSQSSRSVCNVTINEKPYVITSGKDSLTKDELIKAGILRTIDNKYTVLSFQVTIRRFGDFGFIVHGNNFADHYYARAFNNMIPGDRVLMECIQVKDKNGQKQVLESRMFYIIAGQVKLKTDSLK
jgi:hypothetical protein